MSEFSDREFHVGSLTGLRAFAVDALGRLNGPSQGGIFTPGVNEAVCKVDPTTRAMTDALNAQMVALEASLRGLAAVQGSRRDKKRKTAEAESVAASSPARKPPPVARRHTVAGMGCRCGFYAYFDGMNDYMRTGRVAAVVEGFGLYTLGTRGFRTSKARLVALIEPEMGSSDTYYYGGNGWGNSFMVAGPTGPRAESMTPLLWSYVRRNYPDVPVYATQDEAVAAHPLYQLEVPTPETAEDFWTRSL